MPYSAESEAIDSGGTRVFLDTEFTNLTLDAWLISLGAVSADGREFYAELAEGWTPQDCSEFVRQTVLPLLEIPPLSRLTRAQCASRLVLWLCEVDGGSPVVAVTVDSYIDWWMLGLLFDGHGWTLADKDVLVGTQLQRASLRLELAHWGEAERMERFREVLERAMTNLRPHHALDDARALRAAWLAVGE